MLDEISKIAILIAKNSLYGKSNMNTHLLELDYIPACFKTKNNNMVNYIIENNLQQEFKNYCTQQASCTRIMHNNIEEFVNTHFNQLVIDFVFSKQKIKLMNQLFPKI